MTHATTIDPDSRPFRWRWLLWGGALGLLALPAIAMHFTDEVQWGAVDFLVIGTMLATLCGLIELGARLSAHWAYRLGFAIAALAGFTTVWVNLAVGMIGSEDNPQNAVFFGVLLVAAAGALGARFRPQGMAYAMFATAAAMAGAAVYAAFVDDPRVALLIAAWVVAWSAAGLAFGIAAQARRDVPA